MDKYSLYVPNFLPCMEYFDSGKNNACPGCGLSLGIRHIYFADQNLCRLMKQLIDTKMMAK